MQLGQYMNVQTKLAVQWENVSKNCQCHVISGIPGKLADLTKKGILNVSYIYIYIYIYTQMQPRAASIRMQQFAGTYT